MKFLVVWKMEISRLSTEMMKTVLRMPDYAKPLEESGKVVNRYHIVGYHGGHGSSTWNPTTSWKCC